jgi:predicted alpha/beta hydrolase family esterase
MSFNRAVFWSDCWGCELIDMGDAGHINSESGFGEWNMALKNS